MLVGQDSTIIAGADRASDPSIRTFETLDGLRGVAAVAVVIWHLPGAKLLNSAYLAVDLFFILSGFVIAYRYEERLLSNFTGRRFLVMRLIRLYPLYLLGSLIGALWKLWLVVGRHGGDVHRLFVWSKKLGRAILMLPDFWTHGLVYPFNIPAWSLFYEVIANAIYGFTARWTGNRVLAAIILLSAAALTWAVLVYGNMRFTVKMPEFLIGAFRASFGFYVGIALFRLREKGLLPNWRMPPVLIAVLLLLLLAIPRSGPIAPWLTLAVVFVAFPLLVVLALANEPSGVVAKLFSQLGLLSFPLYAIHRPLISIIEHYGRAFHLPHQLISTIVVSVCLALSWLAIQHYDKPVRHWLTAIAKRYMQPQRVAVA